MAFSLFLISKIYFYSVELVCVSWELASDPACMFVLLSLPFFLPGSACLSVLLLNFKNLVGDFKHGVLEGVLSNSDVCLV